MFSKFFFIAPVLILTCICSALELKKKIRGNIAPKSIVHSGTGLFFAQNMMYRHTITVYDRQYNLVATIPDKVKSDKLDALKHSGEYHGSPVEAAFSHNGKYAWVSNYQMFGAGFANPGNDSCESGTFDNSYVYRINTETLSIAKGIAVGSVPKYVAASPDSRLVLVSNWCSGDVSVIDTERDLEVKRIRLGRYPRGIVVDSASTLAYVAVMGSYDIAVVNLHSFSVSWIIGVGRSPRHLVLDPGGQYLYASLNAESTIAKIDLATGKVVRKAKTGDTPRSMVLSENGEFAYVVNYESNTLSKIDCKEMKVLETVATDHHPIGVTYDPQKRQVWVSCYSGTILIFQD